LELLLGKGYKDGIDSKHENRWQEISGRQGDAENITEAGIGIKLPNNFQVLTKNLYVFLISLTRTTQHKNVPAPAHRTYDTKWK
jgi:hypothetical protein